MIEIWCRTRLTYQWLSYSAIDSYWWLRSDAELIWRINDEAFRHFLILMIEIWYRTYLMYQWWSYSAINSYGWLRSDAEFIWRINDKAIRHFLILMIEIICRTRLTYQWWSYPAFSHINDWDLMPNSFDVSMIKLFGIFSYWWLRFYAELIWRINDEAIRQYIHTDDWDLIPN